jgi:hypothetical protein
MEASRKAAANTAKPFTYRYSDFVLDEILQDISRPRLSDSAGSLRPIDKKIETKPNMIKERSVVL